MMEKNSSNWIKLFKMYLMKDPVQGPSRFSLDVEDISTGILMFFTDIGGQEVQPDCSLMAFEQVSEIPSHKMAKSVHFLSIKYL